MSDEPEDKPKRKYTRRINDILDSVVDDAVEEIAEAEGVEVRIGDIVVEEIESDRPQSTFIGAEKVGTSEKAKLIKKYGTNETMRYTPWRGKDMWSCDACRWTTFEKRRARQHACD